MISRSLFPIFGRDTPRGNTLSYFLPPFPYFLSNHAASLFRNHFHKARPGITTKPTIVTVTSPCNSLSHIFHLVSRTASAGRTRKALAQARHDARAEDRTAGRSPRPGATLRGLFCSRLPLSAPYICRARQDAVDHVLTIDGESCPHMALMLTYQSLRNPVKHPLA